MKIKLSLVIISISFIVTLPAVAFANLIYNGDFETGCFTGWTAEWNLANLGIVATNPQSGSFHVRNFYDGGMYQEVPVTPGLVYRFRGYLYAPSGGDSSGWGSYLGFYWMDAQDNLVGTIGMEWILDIQESPRDVYLVGDSENLSNPLKWMTAPEDAVKARIRFGTWQEGAIPAYPTDFDNFYFDVIPEPSSLLLLGIGLFGSVALRKRAIK
ncbi:MAG: hypothetical protein AMJ78_03850 [Omnitrophica WOR_2 bacterium SM23_29]|nr:MAG: hypothetical protein AMJ78_03850 [Omnitrophica WOR_2 bacterium SM23_29]